MISLTFWPSALCCSLDLDHWKSKCRNGFIQKYDHTSVALSEMQLDGFMLRSMTQTLITLANLSKQLPTAMSMVSPNIRYRRSEYAITCTKFRMNKTQTAFLLQIYCCLADSCSSENAVQMFCAKKFCMGLTGRNQPVYCPH